MNYTITGVYEFGFKGTFNGGTVPEKGYDGEAGGGLALSTGWSENMAYYQTVTLPAGNYTISFNWRGAGESVYDYLMVFLIPGNVTPTGTPDRSTYPSNWQLLSTNNSNNYLNLQDYWRIFTKTFSVPADGSYHVVFYWRNDTSAGTQPPAAVDNVVILRTP